MKDRKKIEKFVGTQIIPHKRICGIYFLFDGDEVVYIGMSANIHHRIESHACDGEKIFDSSFYIKCATPEDAAKMERECIREFVPRYNEAGIFDHYRSRINKKMLFELLRRHGNGKTAKDKRMMEYLEYECGKENVELARRQISKGKESAKVHSLDDQQ